MNGTRIKKTLGRLIVILFLLMNIIVIFHGYKFTHFSDNKGLKTSDPQKLALAEKLKTILFGVSNPRPVNNSVPSQSFEILRLQSNKLIECWSIKASNPKGTVILFHGYSGRKSSMLARSDWFLQHGYSTLLVDFMGSGGSEGNQTTIGYKEAEEVKTAFGYLAGKGEKRIILYGTSLGAVAIMKAIYDFRLDPAGIIIECPFGSMYQTTCARFRNMKIPTFPMAGLLVFWGGVQNGFWAFGHNPTEYAKGIKSPTLLLYGAKDDRVSRSETDEIYANLQGEKKLSIYPLAGHDNYWKSYKEEWESDVNMFLKSLP